LLSFPTHYTETIKQIQEQLTGDKSILPHIYNSTTTIMFGKRFGPPVVMGDESIMSAKAHGSSAVPVQTNLRWKCDQKTASNICNYNRHYAEHSGYFEGKPEFLKECKAAAAPGSQPIEFFDSNTGKLLFTAPIDRTMDDFLVESRAHGWPR
jgi:hypothetical protein